MAWIQSVGRKLLGGAGKKQSLRTVGLAILEIAFARVKKYQVVGGPDYVPECRHDVQHSRGQSTGVWTRQPSGKYELLELMLTSIALHL